MAELFCHRCHGKMPKVMTDDDLKAMFAYLRSIPAVKNQVPLPVNPAAPEAKP